MLWTIILKKENKDTIHLHLSEIFRQINRALTKLSCLILIDFTRSIDFNVRIVELSELLITG